MKVKELIKILSKYDGDATVVIHDREYTEYADHWQIVDVYETTSGLIKITPSSNARQDNQDSKQ